MRPDAAPAPPLLALREGVRVAVRRNQGMLGGDKYPGRVGTVQSQTWVGNDHWTVRLDATKRAAAREVLFDARQLEVTTRADQAAALPPMSGRMLAALLAAEGAACVGGARYLVEQKFEGTERGWLVRVAYPDGSGQVIGETCWARLTRIAALHLAADDAIDWWLNRRAPPAAGAGG